MKRLVALAVSAFGVRALLRRRSRAIEPADELRSRLAATRTTDEPEPPAATSADEPLDGVDARRADVHARARQSIDELSN